MNRTRTRYQQEQKSEWIKNAKYVIAIVALIALGAFIEGNTRTVEENNSLKKQVSEQYSNGRQSILEEIKSECTKVYGIDEEVNKQVAWYCSGDFTDY